MKRTFNSRFNLLSNIEMENLTSIVKETIATQVVIPVNVNKPFTPAQLWDLQRRAKPRTSRRFI